jgi:hypothetical protein
MTAADRRTAEQIREEIRAERAQLDTALASAKAEAVRSARIAGTVLAGLAGLRALARLRSHRRAR